MRPKGAEKKDKRRKRGTGGTPPDSRNVDRISPAERKAFEKSAREVPGAKRKNVSPRVAAQQLQQTIARTAIGRGSSAVAQARLEVERKRRPRDDPSFGDIARRGIGRAARTYETAGRAIYGAEKALAKQVLEGVIKEPTTLAGPSGFSGSRLGQEMLVGPEYAKAAHGERPDLLWGAVEAAGIFPLFKPLRALRGARAVKAVEEAAPKAKAVLREPSPTQKVRASLGPARTRRAEQDRLASVERSARVGRAESASEAAGGGIAGYEEAGRELAGELPKVKFAHLREGNLTQADLDDLFRVVQEHPTLRPLEKRRAMRGLLDAFESGKAPQKSQIKLWQAVFGEETADAVVRVSKARKVFHLGLQALNIPRAFMSTLDVSGTLRQSLVAAMGHPQIVARNMKPQFRALVSEKNYRKIMAEVETRPNRDLYDQGGLALTDLEGDLAKREEAFMSNMAETITGGKRSPVRASGRAYTALLNKTRADLFDHLIDVAKAGGHNVEDSKFLRDLGRYVNASTGRGNLAMLESSAPVLNTIFFSPRLAASRIDLLFAPATYARTHPFVRKQALKSMFQLYAAGTLVLTAAAYAGAQVGLDPRNADFAKMRIGNTRIDVFGGFQQYVRLLAQLFSGKVVSSSTGKTLTLGAEFGDLSRKDILERFTVGKFSPPASFVYDFFKGTDYEGQPFSVQKAALQRLAPFIVQDTLDLYRETDSVPLTVGGAALVAIGIGTQTYSDKKLAKTQKKVREALGKWQEPAEKAWTSAHPGLTLPVEVIRAKQTDLMVKALRGELEESLKARGVSEQDRTPEQQNAIEKQELAIHFAVLFRTRPQLKKHQAELQKFVREADPAAVRGALAEVRTDLYQRVLEQFSGELSEISAQQRQKAFAR
jgi:hypothetical protein